MAKWKNDDVGMSNQALANIYTSRGRLDEIHAGTDPLGHAYVRSFLERGDSAVL